jgi:putative transcriptional regulator
MKYIRAFYKEKFLLIGAFFILLPSGFIFFFGQEGQIFISHPQSNDINFNHTVLYMADHTIDGATAFVLNKPYPRDNLKFIPSYIQRRDIPVFLGGPVNDKDDVFIMQFDGVKKPKVMGFDKWIEIDPDILDKVELSPQTYRVFIGYAGWQAVQFEMERLAKGWVIGVRRSFLFPKLLESSKIDPKLLWFKALENSDFYKYQAIAGGIRA